MGIEIERKFLVSSENWRASVEKVTPMRHGYLTAGGNPRASVRVRIEGDQGVLNIKAAVVGDTRAEYEYPIPATEAGEMLASLCGALILKTRHYVHHQGHLWEIDVFEGDNAGLVVAEIELAAADEAFARPDWLGPEVTQLHRYYNNRLAQQPFAGWSPAERAGEGAAS